MDTQLKVVVDTNVLVSASFKKASPIPNYIYQALKFQRFILITSQEILEEVEGVISRDYIVARSKMTEKDRLAFIETIKEVSLLTSRQTTVQSSSRDVTDNKFLACAYEAKANYIVTGDNDLLVLKKYKGTKIIKPRDFVTILESKKGIAKPIEKGKDVVGYKRKLRTITGDWLNDKEIRKNRKNVQET